MSWKFEHEYVISPKTGFKPKDKYTWTIEQVPDTEHKDGLKQVGIKVFNDGVPISSNTYDKVIDFTETNHINAADLTEQVKKYLTDGGYALSASLAPFDAVQEGRFLWITTGGSVEVYELTGEYSNHEPAWESLDDLHGGWGEKKLIYSINVPDGAYWIAKSFTSIWIANKAYKFDKITRIDFNLKTVVEVFDCPEPMSSNLTFENGRLWMVNCAKEDENPNDRQKVYIVGNLPPRRVWASIEIPTKKQLAKPKLCSGNNGYVYVTNFNNVSIAKFNAQTFTFDKFIRTNAFPQQIASSPNRDIFVASYGGMLTRVDGLTDEVFNAYSTVATATSLAPMATDYVWFTSVKSTHAGEEMKFDDGTVIGRVNRTDNSVRFSGKSKKKIDGVPPYNGDKDSVKDVDYVSESNDSGKTVGNTSADAPNSAPTPGDPIKSSITYEVKKHDWNIGTDDINFSNCLVTLPFQYKKFNGTDWDTIDVKPFLVMIGSSQVKIVKLYREFYKEDKLEIYGQGMISTGSEDYLGEIAETPKETSE